MNATTTHETGRNEQMSRLGLLNEPAGYVDGPNLYEFVESNPVGLLDPMGLQATSRPAALGDAALGGGSATFNAGDYSVDAQYSLSALASTHGPMRHPIKCSRSLRLK